MNKSTGKDGVRNNTRIGIHWFDGGRGEDLLDGLPTGGQLLSAGGRAGTVEMVGGSRLSGRSWRWLCLGRQ